MNKFQILGMDIGGANTKAALICFKKDEIIKSFHLIEYFPFWQKTLNEIKQLFQSIKNNLINTHKFSVEDVKIVAVTITAELSDAFKTKLEGIEIITKALSDVFDEQKLKFITSDNKFVSYEQVPENYDKISAANWVASAIFLGQYIEKCILIDSGSTTTDIIPILDGKPVTVGKDDIGRLKNHELVYTGGLRSTIPSITHFVPYQESDIRISFEKFALVSDVHRILGNISKSEYLNDTADNRSKSLHDCYARLSRIICGDINTVKTKDLDIMATYIYQKQLQIIESELKLFIEQLKKNYKEFGVNSDPFVLTGLSSQFLIKPVLKKLNFSEIYIYEDITKISDNVSSTAFAVAGAYYLLNI